MTSTNLSIIDSHSLLFNFISGSSTHSSNVDSNFSKHIIWQGKSYTYALIQSSSGKTCLNAEANEDLRLRLDNYDYFILDTAQTTIGRLSVTNYNVKLNADVSMVTNASVEGDFSVNRIESNLMKINV